MHLFITVQCELYLFYQRSHALLLLNKIRRGLGDMIICTLGFEPVSIHL